MKKLINLISIRPKIRRFLASYFRKNLSFDIEYQLNMRALNSTCKYIEKNMVNIPLYNNKDDALDHVLNEANLTGNYCEFGVYEGKSVNYIAKKLSNKIHAFDSFEGLPETWLSTYKKGHFKLNKLPNFEENVVVHKGWFDDTLPQWINEYPWDIAFLHIDCDLYSSTKSIFDWLNKKIVTGTIILFDEYFNYPCWEQHEFKAFQEFVLENQIKYEYLCYSSSSFGSKVAVKILERTENNRQNGNRLESSPTAMLGKNRVF